MSTSVRSAFAGLALAASLVAFAAAAADAAENRAAPAPAANASAAPARRIPDTLMFTIDELTDIQNRSQSEGANSKTDKGPNVAIENASLYLSTIVYYSPKEWTIWLNGKPISPGQNLSELTITDIGPRFVELVIPLSALGQRPVRLEPNQTFIAKSGAVVEGAWRQ